MSKEFSYKSPELKKLLNVLSSKSSREILFADQYGTTAILWADSYTPLARHITTYNIAELKRYCINQIYKASSIGNPPEPTTELAFDIVTPSASRQADAEVIVTFSKILQECQLPVVLQVSHHLLVKAILEYCGVPEEEQSMACHQLTQKIKNIEADLERYNPIDLTFTRNQTAPDQLLSLFSARGELRAVQSYLIGLPDWQGDIALLAEQAFTELDEIINQAKSHGLHCPVYISVNTCLERYDSHSGFLFRFICQNQEM